MICCYGFAYSDPFSIYSYISQQFKAKEIELFNKNKDYAEECPDVLVFMSVKELVRYLTKYRDNRVVGIVFDAASRLFDIKGLKRVDCKLDKYGLMPRRISNIEGWFDKSQFKRNSTDELEHSPRNLINLLIKFNIEGRFINYYNSFIYSIPVVKRRDECKLMLSKFLFGIYSRDEVLDVANKVIRKKTSNMRKSFDLVMDYFTTDNGINLLTALKEARAKNQAGDFHTYKAIAIKHKVDDYEVRYLHFVFRQFEKAGSLETSS